MITKSTCGDTPNELTMNIHILNIGLHIDIGCIFHSTTPSYPKPSNPDDDVFKLHLEFLTVSVVNNTKQADTSLYCLGCVEDSASSPK